MSEHDIGKMKVADLKKELKARGLSVIGNKNELVDRLQTAMIEGGDVIDDTANSEDLLEDDDLNDDLLEDDKDLPDPVGEEEHMLKSPTPSDTSKADSPEQKLDDIKITPPLPQRKIALKRNISISKPISTGDSGDTSALAKDAVMDSVPINKNGDEKDGEPEKKIIKLGQLSALERLEMRAKKFGSAPAVSSDKLQARAARFGMSSSTSTTATAGNGATPSSLDALKKRSERFGVSVSQKMVKLEQDEKLAKRQARFGQGTVTAPEGEKVIVGTTSVPSAKVDYAEKARLRLERFKTAA